MQWVLITKTKGTDNYTYDWIIPCLRVKNDTDGINFRASDANNYANEWGPSANDRTHNINGFIVIIHSKGQQLLSRFVAKRTTN
jgi:hypothetical protein